MIKVFVYGTLKKGHGNHLLLEQSKYIGRDVLPPEYTMVSLGGFPGVLLKGRQEIHGEVYEVDADTFESLDWLEGYPNFYNRKKINTVHGEAWMYYLDYDRYYDSDAVVEGGCW